jgi:hypothetical protein
MFSRVCSLLRRAAFTGCAVIVATPAFAQSDVTGSGTGFFINADGWLVTNAHVLEGCVAATIPNVGDTSDWKIDKQNDLAVVRALGASGRPFLHLRQSTSRLGEDVAAFGYPLSTVLSDSVKVTTGNVNSLIGLHDDTRYLQISTPIQPGNSGGPLVDQRGALLGITTSTLSLSSTVQSGVLPQNVNFAIRSSVLEIFLQSRGIAYRSTDAVGPALSTADLADKVVPTVVQLLCKQPAAEAAVAAAPSTSPSPATANQALAEAFVHKYHAAWSADNETALAFMKTAYADRVTFYGGTVASEDVLSEKRKFAARWPTRSYTVRADTLSVICRGSECDVSAVVDWYAHSDARNKTSSGAATFELTFNTDRREISRETGKVLKSTAVNVSALINRWQDENGRCRGGSGDDPKTYQACDERSATGNKLAEAGWCYGREGEAGYQMEWHPCAANSTR